VQGYFAAGITEEDILKNFPCLTRDDIRACITYEAEQEARSNQVN
jgi:uncharacterized protein (DUF433 family)